jgi:hypothetical protein
MAKDRMFSPDAPEVAIRIYGGISRVTSREGLKVLALDVFGVSTTQTGNIVYQQVLSTWHGFFLHKLETIHYVSCYLGHVDGYVKTFFCYLLLLVRSRLFGLDSSYYPTWYWLI